ncbi:hypothetical protein M6D81_15395 [Paenibacillus sp. J5C_2022]|uniref:hypothetical protein n=1 Tax=Paenibacillus sp. J5C2022 TaxID=2977129 RepID=UPI0021CE1BAF|nr:hypothetical protein [Paenibacillus sp. J5C2022]MCU6710081.1 hypothetical protein [Paenibacillus sp. J5C2022]
MNFQSHNGYSHVKQDFIWLSEHIDGTFLCEFSDDGKISNSFYDIDTDKLIRFGLIGRGMKLYHEVKGGMFNLNGQHIMISYIDEENKEEYFLTGHNNRYDDIISYKNAFTDGGITKNGSAVFTHPKIRKFNFGYKKKIAMNDILFHFQPIFCLPYNTSAYLDIKLVSSKDMEGKLRFYRSGHIVDEIEAPLKEGFSGNVHWNVK